MSKLTFKRSELKYVLTSMQYGKIVREIKNRLNPDEYGKSTIQSLYYDTDTFLLIRNSLEKPDYKEKLRARSYGLCKNDEEIFFELKKKYEKVVYKRRVRVTERHANELLNGKEQPQSQVEKEIVAFSKRFCGLSPKMLLLYDREAYYGGDLRITFDHDARYRTQNLNLHTSTEGKRILPNGEVIMEIKASGGYPLWLVEILNEEKIFKTSFSKYGTAYLIELKKSLERKKEIA